MELVEEMTGQQGITDPRYQLYIGLNVAAVFLTCGFWLPVWGAIEVVKYFVRR